MALTNKLKGQCIVMYNTSEWPSRSLLKKTLQLDRSNHQNTSQHIPRGFPHWDDLFCAVTPHLMGVIGQGLVTDPGGQIPQVKILLSGADPQAEAQIQTQAWMKWTWHGFKGGGKRCWVWSGAAFLYLWPHLAVLWQGKILGLNGSSSRTCPGCSYSWRKVRIM